MLIIAYGEMHEYLALIASLNSVDSGFHWLMVLFGNTKMVLYCLVLFWKLIENPFD